MVHKLRDDYGENSVNAKLTNEQADHIRRLHRSGVMQNELAEQFKVCKQTICDIVHYKKYLSSTYKCNFLGADNKQ